MVWKLALGLALVSLSPTTCAVLPIAVRLPAHFARGSHRRGDSRIRVSARGLVDRHDRARMDDEPVQLHGRLGRPRRADGGHGFGLSRSPGSIGLDALAQGCAALASGALGFLAYNFPPARAFMGDAGSIPLGFLAGALGLHGIAAGAWPFGSQLLVFSPFMRRCERDDRAAHAAPAALLDRATARIATSGSCLPDGAARGWRSQRTP
jgi:hypothetical protein